MTDEPRLDNKEHGEDWVELWLLPAPFDLVEDNCRAIVVSFSPGASDEDTATELDELSLEFDVLRCDPDYEAPHEAIHLKGCTVRFEADVAAETAALLLYRASYLIRHRGIPKDSELIVLSDPDRVWKHGVDCSPNAVPCLHQTASKAAR